MEQKKELIKFHDCEIFTIMENKQSEKPLYSILLGNNVLEHFETKEEAENHIKTKPWELIYKTIVVISQFINNQQKLKLEENEN